MATRMARAAKLLAVVLVLATGRAYGQPAPAVGADPGKQVLVLNYVLYGRHAPFFVGIDKGFYKDAGIDLQVVPSGGSGVAISAVDAGKADFAMAEASTIIQNIAKGAKVRAFEAFLESTPNGLASLKPYPDLAAVLESKVAAAATDSARSVLPIVVALRGLDPLKIQWQTAANNTYLSLLISGQVDSFSASIDADLPPLRKSLQGTGKQVYFSSFADWGYDGLGFLLLTRTQRLSEDPEKVKGFAAATAKAVEYSIAHPQEATQIMSKYNPTLDPETLLEQWQLTVKAIQTPYKEQHGFGIVTMDRVQRTIDLARKTLNITADVAPEQVFAAGFVRK